MRAIFSIQVLRALAALGVVVAHAYVTQARHAGLPPGVSNLMWGKAGVDVFFVVSGFVMVHASDRLFGTACGPPVFLARRLIRIVPLYWFVTTIYLAIAAVLHQLPHKSYSAALVVASYAFIPWPNPDGLVEPIVGQGWTLNYEMLFYVIFSGALLFSRRIAVALVSLILVAAAIAGKLIDPTPGPLSFWTDSVVLEFVLGMALGLAYQEGTRLSRWCRLLLVGGALVLTGLIALQPWFYVTRAFARGVPAAMIVAGAVLGTPTGPSAGWRRLGIIGDASYALYLLHPLPVRTIDALLRRFGFDPAVYFWPYIAIATIASVALAVAAHYWLERPVTRALRAAFEARRAIAAPASSL
jgi:exopolysaccharide production protein ExoZ